MRRPRTKPAETRRDELMNAAERLFLSDGVGATTIEQITARAHVAKGTFSFIFLRRRTFARRWLTASPRNYSTR